MSKFGETWRIDGVTAAYIAAGPANGQYQVVFERSSAELTDIEGINWESPIVEPLRADCPALTGLPQGYGFAVTDITYDHASRSYTVTAEVSARYLGDAAGYEAQAEELKEQAAQARQQGAPLRRLVQVRPKGGGLRWLSVEAVWEPQEDGGHLICVFCTDATEETEVNAQRQFRSQLCDLLLDRSRVMIMD